MNPNRPSALVPLCLLAAVAVLAGCSKKKVEPPARATDAVPTPTQSSTLAVPIDVDTAALRGAIDQAIPRQLWTINQHSARCVKPKQVKVFGARLKVTPPISCTIVGTVTRGAIRLRGEGQDIIADMPIQARIAARDVGGILKGETATASAMAHARIRLDIDGNWNPRGTVKLSYSWTETPGIDFLGQRITFTDEADEKLQPVIRDLERTLPRELAKMELRSQVERLWRRGFTSVELNREKPPVWMRITPQKLHFGGYEIQGQRLRLNLGLDALTETFVGQRPADPKPGPLPALERSNPANSLKFNIPVVADYAELQPVVLRALVKRSRRPFDLPGVGAVSATFDKVVVYSTTGGRIAVGVTLAAKSDRLGGEPTRGLIWLTARPVNAPGSAEVRFADLSVTGDTDGIGGDLLLQLGSSAAFSNEIASSLTQNFTRDLNELLGKVRRAIDEKRTGDFVVRATIGKVETGQITAHGQGLYLPVRVDGSASVTYRPTP